MRELELRPLQDQDKEQLFDRIDANRDQLAKFWWEQETKSSEDSQKFIQSVNDLEDQNGAPTRGIFLASRLIGVAALHTIDWERRSSMLGYWLDKSESGKGYGTEICQTLVDLAFNKLGLVELCIATNADNQASRAVAEKCGFTLQEISPQPLWQVHEHKLISTAIYKLQRN